jgi:formylmethanofuran dehydrogenase subunit E
MNPVEEFLQTWKKRKSGELPPADLKVSCSRCGNEIIGDTKVEYDPEGLLCESCFREKNEH